MRAIRVFLAVLAVLAVAIVGLVKVRLISQPAHAQALTPNVVVIMVDDLDVGSLEAAVVAELMPNFTELLYGPNAEAKIFTNAFVSYALCCPSRATFLTGQYAHNHGVKNNEGDEGGCEALNDNETIATWLQGVDYHTGFVGKYLNGYGDDDSEHPCSDPQHVPEGWDNWQGLVDAAKMVGFKINNNTQIEGPFGSTVYQTTKLAEKAALFIENAPALDPFFLWVNPFAPHIEPAQVLCANNIFPNAATIRTPSPYDDDAAGLTLPQGVSFNEDDVLDKPEPIRSDVDLLDPNSGHITCTENVWRDRLESLQLVDKLIGDIVVALVAKEVDENTVVVFTSDNGYYHGEHRLQKKVFPYEEGIRVPLVILNPSSPQKDIFEQFVVNTDLAPTIAELAGVSPPTGFVDGRSLIEMLGGENPSTWRKRFLIEHWNAPATDFIPTFFGIRTADTDTTLLTPNALYMEYFHPTTPTEFEYYELDDDPNQMDNLCYEDEDLEDCEEAPTAFPGRLTALRNCSGNEPPTSCFSLEN